MYSSKPNVNTLTALLAEHGISHAVVCPGSRNAPLVHNLNECPTISCHPVTDERSAGFFALGLAQATDQPVVVCVTSGTALLNLAPAVAEAHYQHQSLIVVSADRPAAWIDQLDGQTLQQPGALSPWVECSVSLPEWEESGKWNEESGKWNEESGKWNEESGKWNEEHWHCNRLVNEALMAATADHRPCVHINVPISEPLFAFTTPQLPDERVIRSYAPAADYDCLPQPLVDDLLAAQRPLIVFGQLSPRRFHYEAVDQLFSRVIVLHEALAPMTSVSLFDEVLAKVSDDEQALLPDFILYVGDAVVSKRLKHFLRRAADARCWRISLTGQVEDTFQNLRGIVLGDTERTLQALSAKMSKQKWSHSHPRADYRRRWLHLLSEARQRTDSEVLPYGEAAAVRLFEQQLQQAGCGYEVHYANSSAVRLANRYAMGHPVWCNRGVNGIEGSLSTAAGFAAALHPSPSTLVFCVIGDLSFFYDQNALWNQRLSPALRILLLNNGHGAIFDQLPGLEQSPVRDDLVAARHDTTAEGICRQNHVEYSRANDMAQLQDSLGWLMEESSAHARLLEVVTGEKTNS